MTGCRSQLGRIAGNGRQLIPRCVRIVPIDETDARIAADFLAVSTPDRTGRYHAGPRVTSTGEVRGTGLSG